MKSFEYIIKDETGIHARPAGLLVKECTKFKSDITIEVKGQTVSAKKLFQVMGLGAKKGDNIVMNFQGEDEEAAALAIETFINNNL